MTLKDLVEKYNSLNRTIKQVNDHSEMIRNLINKNGDLAGTIIIPVIVAIDIDAMLVQLRHYIEKELDSEVKVYDKPGADKETDPDADQGGAQCEL